MDQKSLETLARLKELMKDTPVKKEPSKGQLSARDFELLAGCLGVSGYEHLKPKKNRLYGEEREASPPTPSHKPAAELEKYLPPKRTDWIKSKCIICRAEFAYPPEWKRKPVLCQGCRNERKSTYKPSKTGKGGSALSKNYSHITIFRGGSPGGGKRS